MNHSQISSTMDAGYNAPNNYPSGVYDMRTSCECPDFQISQREELKYRFLYWINAYPSIFMPLARIRYRDATDLLVTRETDLVIEAFGRAGSTFANFAFLSAQTKPVKTVHHTHASAQVLTAVQLGIPTLVIVRRPEDSALSHMVRHRISAKTALTAWIRFHARILPKRHEIVLTTFEQMSQDFGFVIHQINRRFRTDFAIFQHTAENNAAIFERIRQRNRQRFGYVATEMRTRSLALPTAEREAMKRALSNHLNEPSIAALREHAQDLYNEITA
jgi:hypothetical protein